MEWSKGRRGFGNWRGILLFVFPSFFAFSCFIYFSLVLEWEPAESRGIERENGTGNGMKAMVAVYAQ